MVRSLSPTSRLVYLQGKPKPGGVSSRDFCYVMHRYVGSGEHPLSKIPSVPALSNAFISGLRSYLKGGSFHAALVC